MPCKKFKILIHKINEENENQIQKIIVQFPNSDVTLFEKRVLVLKEKNTTLINKNSEKINIQDLKNSFSLNNSFILSLDSISLQNYSNISNSTFQDTQSQIRAQNYSTIENEFIEKKFNSLRSNFYIKFKLHDIALYEGYNNFNFPPKYIINDELSAFLYPNEIITFTIIKSGFFKKDNLIFDQEIEKIKDNKFNQKVGLIFCEKNIQINTERGKEIKKCSPNIFMCKTCMEKNKRLYNIKSKYLININGRVSKINKGSYHCFGHFLIGNTIEDCISKFSCKACTLLNLYTEYYKTKEEVKKK